jgi:hypothetical protein
MKIPSFWLYPRWSDPTWRHLRITSFCTAAITLILLVIVLSGASSFRYALAAAVILNFVVAVGVGVRTYTLHARQRHLPKP